jgi:hypothetical protein
VRELIDGLERVIFQADPIACPALLGELERLKGIAWARIISGHSASNPSITRVENGHYLTVGEVCERFGVTTRWLYRHKNQMPHSQPSRKILLFPEQGIAKWFASRHVP